MALGAELEEYQISGLLPFPPSMQSSSGGLSEVPGSTPQAPRIRPSRCSGWVSASSPTWSCREGQGRKGRGSWNRLGGTAGSPTVRRMGQDRMKPQSRVQALGCPGKRKHHSDLGQAKT